MSSGVRDGDSGWRGVSAKGGGGGGPDPDVPFSSAIRRIDTLRWTALCQRCSVPPPPPPPRGVRRRAPLAVDSPLLDLSRGGGGASLDPVVSSALPPLPVFKGAWDWWGVSGRETRPVGCLASADRDATGTDSDNRASIGRPWPPRRRPRPDPSTATRGRSAACARMRRVMCCC